MTEKKSNDNNNSKGIRALIETLVMILVVIVSVILVQMFLVKPYQIPSGSMLPTLTIGQRIFVNKFIYHFKKPKVGDVIVFHPPISTNESFDGEECAVEPKEGEACPASVSEKDSITFIKRIVAGPGDEIYIKNGYPIVNGKKMDLPESSITKCDPHQGVGCDFLKEITIPAKHYYVMGDNRGNSEDSRFWGPLPEEWIIGKAFATYWPLNRIGGV